MQHDEENVFGEEVSVKTGELKEEVLVFDLQ